MLITNDPSVIILSGGLERALKYMMGYTAVLAMHHSNVSVHREVQIK